MSNTKILNVEQTIASLYKQLCHYRSTVVDGKFVFVTAESFVDSLKEAEGTV